MYSIIPYPLNMQISIPSLGGTLRLNGGTQYFPNSTRILYRPIQTCRMIFVTLLLVILDALTNGTFAPPRLICVDMPQILESFHSS